MQLHHHGNSLRIPKWCKVTIPCNKDFSNTQALMKKLHLNTVCSSAKCPNMFECYSKKTATFLIMGNTCTRNCSFCNIAEAHPGELDLHEPKRVADAALALGLKHIVITSVTRDDLTDGGSNHFAATIRAVKKALPHSTVEVLIPDFKGSYEALHTVIEAEPDIINHNVETSPRLYPSIRPQADYRQSLELLKRVHEAGVVSKSGLMVGLGETDIDVLSVISDLHEVCCKIVTVGQYMRPSKHHPAVQRYVTPEIFAMYASKGTELGIPHMHSAPLVRSSYNADRFIE